MEQDHMIILGLLALIALMVMKHSHTDNKTPTQFIRYGQGGVYYATGNGYASTESSYPLISIAELDQINRSSTKQPIRSHSDKYIGKSQNVVQHIRYDNKQGMFDGIFGRPQHIKAGPLDGPLPGY